jgi:hypothetical protein
MLAGNAARGLIPSNAFSASFVVLWFPFTALPLFGRLRAGNHFLSAVIILAPGRLNNW